MHVLLLLTLFKATDAACSDETDSASCAANSTCTGNLNCGINSAYCNEPLEGDCDLTFCHWNSTNQECSPAYQGHMLSFFCQDNGLDSECDDTDRCVSNFYCSEIASCSEVPGDECMTHPFSQQAECRTQTSCLPRGSTQMQCLDADETTCGTRAGCTWPEGDQSMCVSSDCYDPAQGCPAAECRSVTSCSEPPLPPTYCYEWQRSDHTPEQCTSIDNGTTCMHFDACEVSQADQMACLILQEGDCSGNCDWIPPGIFGPTGRCTLSFPLQLQCQEGEGACASRIPSTSASCQEVSQCTDIPTCDEANSGQCGALSTCTMAQGNCGPPIAAQFECILRGSNPTECERDAQCQLEEDQGEIRCTVNMGAWLHCAMRKEHECGGTCEWRKQCSSTDDCQNWMDNTTCASQDGCFWEGIYSPEVTLTAGGSSNVYHDFTGGCSSCMNENGTNSYLWHVENLGHICQFETTANMSSLTLSGSVFVGEASAGAFCQSGVASDSPDDNGEIRISGCVAGTFAPSPPTLLPTSHPTTAAPSTSPTTHPTVIPGTPTNAPTSASPTNAPTVAAGSPTTAPSVAAGSPTTAPSVAAGTPTTAPSVAAGNPTTAPSVAAGNPTTAPSVAAGNPTTAPSVAAGNPTTAPSVAGGNPTTAPSSSTSTVASAASTRSPVWLLGVALLAALHF